MEVRTSTKRERGRLKRLGRSGTAVRTPEAGLVARTAAVQSHQIDILRERIKQLEQALAQADLNKADENHPIAMVQLSSSAMIRGCNPAALQLLGKEGEEQTVTSTSFLRFVAASDRSAVLKHLGECSLIHEGRRQIETNILVSRPDGKSWPARMVTGPPRMSGVKRIYPTALIDMSECHLGQQWLKLEDRSFQQLIDSMDGIVWEAEYPAKVLYVSAQVERVLGYPPESFVNNPRFWEEHMHVDDRERVLTEREAAFREGGHHIIEYRFHSAHAAIVWLRDSVVVTRLGEGHARIQGLAINITALKSAEMELRRANENLARQAEEHKRHLEQTIQSMETFCYGIAHELRAPLRALSGFGEIVLQELGDTASEDVTRHLRRITGGAHYMDRLIADLLAYGRLHHTDLLILPVRLNNMIGRVLQALAPEIENRQALVRVRPSNESVYAHPMLLSQAIQNLVSNALKFVEPGKAPEVEVSTRAVEGRVRLSVRDNGVGIEASCQHKIFGVFQRAHSAEEFPGTGIGLAMVKRIVDVLNGEVGLVSAPGEGSTFWIDLPRAPTAATPPSPGTT